MSDLARTPLHDWHVGHGGRMVDFAGWSMPVQYHSIVEEHQATRQRAAVFDISHMGRIRLNGAGACRFLDRILTRRITDLSPGAIRYSLITNQAGGILDDVLAYCLDSKTPHYLLVVNASNREKILDWMTRQKTNEDDVAWRDETLSTGMLALQGPLGRQILHMLVADPSRLDALKYYSAATIEMHGQEVLVSRTGYTGEDGYELIVPAEITTAVWEQILERGADQGVQPAGLGARDTLRLEAGMPLYGHELSEQINPYEADLAFAVQLKGRHFIGRDALALAALRPPARKRVGLTLDGRRVPREGFAVICAGKPVGHITSGTFSPTLQQPIAMAMISPTHAEPGHELEVDVRGKTESARVVKLPFYRRTT